MPSSTPVINYIELPASRLEATKRFYSKMFGWTWVDYGPTYAAFEGDGLSIGLNSLAVTCPASDPDSEDAIGPFVLFETDDIEAAQAEIVAAGGGIASSIYPYPGGRRLHFQDPSWNILGVYQSAPAEET